MDELAHRYQSVNQMKHIGEGSIVCATEASRWTYYLNWQSNCLYSGRDKQPACAL